MKKIFITGGTGFIGGKIVAELMQKNHELYILTRQNKADTNQAHFIQGDISDTYALEKMMKAIKPDSLVHLAWNVKDDNYAHSLENRNWIKWSNQIADCFLSTGGKTIIAAGTCFEYDLTLGEPLTEESPCKPQTLYGECKLQVEQLLKEKCDSADARFAWGRIFYPYGREEEKRKLFSSVISNLNQDQPFMCKSENTIDYIHGADVAGMFVQLMENGDLSGIFNIGSGIGYRVRDLVMMIANKMGKKNLVSFEASKIKQTIISDNTKILSAPYTLQYNIERGLEEMIKRNDQNGVPTM